MQCITPLKSRGLNACYKHFINSNFINSTLRTETLTQTLKRCSCRFHEADTCAGLGYRVVKLDFPRVEFRGNLNSCFAAGMNVACEQPFVLLRPSESRLITRPHSHLKHSTSNGNLPAHGAETRHRLGICGPPCTQEGRPPRASRKTT